MELQFIENENKFFIKKIDTYYSVTETVYIILRKYTLDYKLKDISIYLNNKENTNFYDETIIKDIIFSDNIQKIINYNNSNKNNYIFLKINLLNPEKIKKTLFYLEKILFNKII